MRALVVEDNHDLATSIATSIEQMQHAVDTIDNGLQAEQLLRTEPYDIVILDLNLPGQDGLQVLKNIRQHGISLPVLILTARTDTDSRVKGLDLGADDYLTKPFHLAELDARVRALLRRHMTTSSATLKFGDLIFDSHTKQAWCKDQELNLTNRERGVLEILIANRNKVLSKRQIVDHLFSFHQDVSENAIEIYIHRLRKKLNIPGITIKTVRGLGYSLAVD